MLMEEEIVEFKSSKFLVLSLHGVNFIDWERLVPIHHKELGLGSFTFNKRARNWLSTPSPTITFISTTSKLTTATQ